MSEPQSDPGSVSKAPPRKRGGSWLNLVLTIVGGCVAVAVVWHIVGREMASEYQRWRKEARAAEDNTAVGYIGLNYRRSYNDRPLVFLTREDGRTTLFAAKREGGAPPEVYDVTDAAIDMNALEGGFGRDSIPGIDYPIIEPPDGPRAQNLRNRRPIFGVELAAGPRAYPRELLEKIEVVNDRDGDTPFIVVYDRSRSRAFAYRGGEATFGTTGYTRSNQPVLYDRKTASLWVFEGDDFVCVSGARKGEKLETYRTPASTTWGEWLAGHGGSTVVVGNDRSKPIPTD